MIIMPNKTYKLYSDGVVLNFIFQDKSFSIKAPIGGKVIATYMIGETVRSLYGKLKSTSLNEAAEGNDKLLFNINSTTIPFTSMVSLDVIELPKDSEGNDIDISNPSEPEILLKDLLLQDLDDLYVALNAEDAFKEIAQKVKAINIAAGVSINDSDTSSTKTTLSASKIIDEIVQNIASLVDGSAENLNTFKEFATAINNDPTFATDIINALGNKVDKVTGKGLSTNDYSVEDKTKVDKIVTTGDGSKVLSDNGTYVTPDPGISIDDANNTSTNTTYSASKIEEIAGTKVNAVEGKGLSSNDFDTTAKGKVDKIVTDGTGDKVLADNGTYITPPDNTGASIDDANNTSTDTTYSAAKIEEVVGNKVDKVEGKGLSTNDFDTTAKGKVDKIIIDGTGAKVLADNGTYITPPDNTGIAIDDSTPTSTSTTYSASKIEEIAGTKVNAVEGKGLSTNDFDATEKDKVDKIIIDGTGSKFLSDNGTYQVPSGTGTGASIDDATPTSTSTTYSAAKIEEIAGTKVNAVEGKGLSTNDFGTTEKGKVDKIIIDGDGNSVLANNGNYVTLPQGGTGGASIDDASPTSTSTTYSAAKIEEIAGTKVNAVEGKGLSTNDFDATEKAKVDKIVTTGDGSKVLSDNGTYITPPSGTTTIEAYTDQEMIDLVNTVWGA